MTSVAPRIAKPRMSQEEFEDLVRRAQEILGASKTFLLSPRERPYLAPAIYALREVPRLNLGTFAVDTSWRMYYDPESVVAWNDVEGIAAIMEHEVWHLLRDHPKRAQIAGVGTGATMAEMRLGRIWNWAADAEIHSDPLLVERIQRTFIDVTTGEKQQIITPEFIGSEPGHTAEFYYQFLLDNSEKQPPQPPPPPPPPGGEDGGPWWPEEGAIVEGECGGGGSGGITITNPETGDQMDVNIPIDLPGTPKDETTDKPNPVEGNDGSGATGQKAPWEDDEDGGPGQTGKEIIKRKIARKIIERSRSRGTGTEGWIREWAEDYIRGPKIPWQQQLSNLIVNAVNWARGQMEYTRRRPSRRQLPGMPIMPGMTQPIPEIAIVIDTSGSMSEDLLADALSETAGVIQAFGHQVGVQIYSVDDAVGWAGRVVDISQVELVGAGGTDMGKGIRAAIKGVPRPNIVIILTDGGTPWPATIPSDIAFVIGIVGDKDRILNQATLPDWAKKIIWIDED
jgi:predicted metal-dependent peptidase